MPSADKLRGFSAVKSKIVSICRSLGATESSASDLGRREDATKAGKLVELDVRKYVEASSVADLHAFPIQGIVVE